MKKLLLILTIIAILSVAILFTFYIGLLRYAEQPTDSHSENHIVFIVPPGSGFNTVAKELLDKKLIHSPVKFRYYAWVKGYEKRLKAGEYLLSAVMTPRMILDHLSSGKVMLYRVTIPEGYNINQVSRRFANSGLDLDTSTLLAAFSDPDLINHFGIKASSFEGYLFPDTYFFPKGTSIKNIIGMMVSHFNTQFSPEWKVRAKELNLTVHEVVTLASIIEKETGAAEERPIISSVFHNRLKRKMRLETDPSVIYGIKDFDGNITRKHLKTLTPYNTYMIKGLPPGPIASPGAAALEAALYPAETNFLYFVSKKDGTHHFSTNYSSHIQAVKKYQLRK
ncbi:MAG: endolytic transglycosylase MltG [Desulfobacterales bacterium]|nr:endolytic transglycosylase MltG [Desulfobacterales bacterium]